MMALVSGHHCHRHTAQRSHDVCGSCGRSFCEPCLVYLGGPAALPRCNGCALVAAGIRAASSVRPVSSRRHLRRLQRARRREGQPPTRAHLSTDPLGPMGPTTIDTPERDPFSWADDLGDGWSATYRP